MICVFSIILLVCVYRQSELLLHLCQRHPETKSYTRPLELAWDAGKSASPKNLKQSIADALSCPVERIVIAKKFPDRCQWLIIDDGTNAVSVSYIKIKLFLKTI